MCAGRYKDSALLTDLYQLTMAYGYWKSSTSDRDAVFHLSFRKNPFQGGFSIACGLSDVIEFLEAFAFSDSDLQYMSTLTGNDNERLFEDPFLEYLKNLEFSCDVDAVPEGTIVFPHEPLIRISGPIVQAQILETALLNIINFQTLIATKAARVCLAARGDAVLEFGLRRAHGIDGALAASRAAYIGGCDATSNVLAGKIFGIPVKGTHAHSWVMSFDDELAAFEAYAQAMPNNCVFLVDTYDSIGGVRRAIEVGLRLRQRGHKLMGIRLDSGDLAYLSIEARKLLDEAGFHDAVIVASNDLDEHIIESLKQQGATIAVWGVGTRLATAYDQPALGGVYKLTALRNPQAPWEPKVKLSEQSLKISTPGIQQVRRYHAGLFVADAIYDTTLGIPNECVIVDPVDMTRRKTLPANLAYQDLLVPIFRHGQCVYENPNIQDSKGLATRQLSQLHHGIKRSVNPHEYPVGLEQALFRLKTDLVLKARGLGTE